MGERFVGDATDKEDRFKESDDDVRSRGWPGCCWCCWGCCGREW